MTFERDEFRELLKEQPKRRPSDQPRQRLEQLVAQAEVAVGNLTNDPTWDWFLQVIQHALDASRQEYEALVAQWRDTTRFDIPDLLDLKVRVAQVTADIRTLESVIALPRRIKETAAEAREEIRLYGE